MPDFQVIQSISNDIIKHCSFYLCTTLKLTVRFFSYLSKHYNDQYSWSRKIIDAVVNTLYGDYVGQRTSNIEPVEFDWLSVIQFFPYMTRMVIDLAIHQCKFDPNRDWPDLVLKVIGRNDLCSKNSNY